MSEAPNPYAPPTSTSSVQLMAAPVDERALGDLVERHTIAAGRAPIAQWELSFHTEALVAVRGDGVRLTFSRAQLVADTDLVLGTMIRALTVRQPMRASIALSPGAVAALRRLLEPVLSAHLAGTLKRRLRLSLPIGALVVLTSLPAFALSLDIGGLVFGGGLIVLALVSRVWTHRALLLGDAALWGVLATNNALRLADGGSTWMFGTFAALGVLFGLGSLKLFGFYGASTRV